MCGIAGLLVRNGRLPAAKAFDAFTDSLAHRGPDGRGVWRDEEQGVFLGHRRLAILDRGEGGVQPMVDSTGRFRITFNGEIYNFLELRDELVQLGHVFHSESDTEVILAAYRQWGEDCQLRFNGMWAFGIWDRQERRLFLSRDRFGVKPLHYLWDGRRFAFASEMKAFLYLPDFDCAHDPTALAMALGDYTSVEATETCLISGLRRLVGGHCLILEAGQEPRVRRWWNTLDHLVMPPEKEGERISRFRELLLDATRLRMRSDVPIATALSGGLDSSSVVASLTEAARSGGRRLPSAWRNAYIADFPGTVQDETEYALEIARYCGVMPHVRRIAPQDAIDHLTDVIFQFEEVYDIPVALWLIYREMRRSDVVVSLDGHGGDELLAGYHHYPRQAYSESLRWPPKPHRAKAMADIFRGLHAPGVPVPPLQVGSAARNELLRRARPYGVTAKAIGRRLLRRPAPTKGEPRGPATWLALPPHDRAMPLWDADVPRLKGADAVTRQLYVDFHITTLPTILRNFDRMSMAHGVEIRAPFLDWRLVTYGFSLPTENKLGKGYSKLILRQAMQGLMPDSIRLRRSKLGFVFPLLDWAREALRPFILDLLSSQEFRESPIWNAKAIFRDVEDAFARNDMALVRHAWPFLQSAVLVEQFRKRRWTQ